MIDTKNKICIFKGCNTKSAYNYKNQKPPLYCKKHKLKNMINILTKKCAFTDCYK